MLTRVPRLSKTAGARTMRAALPQNVKPLSNTALIRAMPASRACGAAIQPSAAMMFAPEHTRALSSSAALAQGPPPPGSQPPPPWQDQWQQWQQRQAYYGPPGGKGDTNQRDRDRDRPHGRGRREWVEFKLGTMWWWRQTRATWSSLPPLRVLKDPAQAASPATWGVATVRDARALKHGVRDALHGIAAGVLTAKLNGGLLLLAAIKIWLPSLLPSTFVEARRRVLSFLQMTGAKRVHASEIDAVLAKRTPDGREPTSAAEVLAAAWGLSLDHPAIVAAQRYVEPGAAPRSAGTSTATGAASTTFAWTGNSEGDYATSTAGGFGVSAWSNAAIVQTFPDDLVLKLAEAIGATGIGWHQEQRALPAPEAATHTSSSGSAAKSRTSEEFQWNEPNVSGSDRSFEDRAASLLERLRRYYKIFRDVSAPVGKAPAVPTTSLRTMVDAAARDSVDRRAAALAAIRMELAAVLDRIQRDDSALRHEAFGRRGLFGMLPPPPTFDAAPPTVWSAASGAPTSTNDSLARRLGLSVLWPAPAIARARLQDIRFADCPHVTGVGARPDGARYGAQLPPHTVRAFAELAAVCDQRFVNKLLAAQGNAAAARDATVLDALSALDAWLCASARMPVALVYAALLAAKV